MVLGVDTHQDAHVAAVISVMGKTLAGQSFPATAVGYDQLIQWAARLGAVRSAGVEGSGNYGAALSRYLLSRGIDVFEAPGPGRAARVVRATRFTLRSLAERIEHLTVQSRELEQRLAEVIESHYPALLAAAGVGPRSAAVLLITMGDNADRLRGEASFAALCGCAEQARLNIPPEADAIVGSTAAETGRPMLPCTASC